MSEPRSFEIEYIAPGHSRVVVDGADVTHQVRAVRFSHHVGELPRADIDMVVIRGATVGSQARVAFLFDGEEFTVADVEGLRRRDYGVVDSVADRLARVLGGLA